MRVVVRWVVRWCGGGEGGDEVGGGGEGGDEVGGEVVR